jgi:hypothetical protein
LTKSATFGGWQTAFAASSSFGGHASGSDVEHQKLTAWSLALTDGIRLSTIDSQDAAERAGTPGAAFMLANLATIDFQTHTLFLKSDE